MHDNLSIITVIMNSSGVSDSHHALFTLVSLSASENTNTHFRKDHHGPHRPLQGDRDINDQGQRAWFCSKARQPQPPPRSLPVISSPDSVPPFLGSLFHVSHLNNLSHGRQCHRSPELTSRLAPGRPGVISAQTPTPRPGSQLVSKEPGDVRGE